MTIAYRGGNITGGGYLGRMKQTMQLVIFRTRDELCTETAQRMLDDAKQTFQALNRDTKTIGAGLWMEVGTDYQRTLIGDGNSYQEREQRKKLCDKVSKSKDSIQDCLISSKPNDAWIDLACSEKEDNDEFDDFHLEALAQLA